MLNSKLTRIRADLVPVFSFGENDVSLFARGERLDLTFVLVVDLQTNAQRKGNNPVHSAEEVPERIRVYASSVSWPWVVKLCVRSFSLSMAGSAWECLHGEWNI